MYVFHSAATTLLGFWGAVSVTVSQDPYAPYPLITDHSRAPSVTYSYPAIGQSVVRQGREISWSRRDATPPTPMSTLERALLAENADLRRTIQELRGEATGVAGSGYRATPGREKPVAARHLPLLFMNMEDLTDTVPDPPPEPPAPAPPPPPSYANQSWFVATGVNANGPLPTTRNATLNGTQPDAGACERSCVEAAGCTVFTWNMHSHHCYHRSDGVWTPSAQGWGSDHTVSGCVRAAVPGCGAPSPPAPPPPHVATSVGKPSLIVQVANSVLLREDLTPPPFDYTMCTIIAAPCVAAAFEVLGHPGLIEVFVANASTFENNRAYSSVDLLRYTTSDFQAWSDPEVVMHLPGKPEGDGQQEGEAMVKSIARNDHTGEYLAAMWVGQKLTMYSARAETGKPLAFKVLAVHPFADKDDLNLMYDTERQIWVDMQIHMVHAKLQYCDNAGYDFTRWISARNSTDGVHWSNNSALRGPEIGDPPELEFYRMRPFYLGASGRFAAHTLNYAPSPMSVNRLTRYGRWPPEQKFCVGTSNKEGSPSGPCPGTPENPTGPSGFARTAVCLHGPHMFEEWWMPPPSGDPMDVSGWQRPFKRLKANPQVDGAASASMMAQPVLWRDQHIFVDDGMVMAVPVYRIAGMYAPANGVFTTQPFIMPKRLHLNAAAKWHGRNAATGNRTCDEGCGAYIMVALHRAGAKHPVSEEFVAERCTLLNVDDVRLPLVWEADGKAASTTQFLGHAMTLRIYFRDATVYAVDSED